MSVIRTIVWSQPALGYVGSGLRWPDKLPLDNNPYGLNVSNWLGSEGVTISSLSASERSGLLVISGVSIAGSTCKLRIAGGVPSLVPYVVDLIVTDSLGNIGDFAVEIAVDNGPLVQPGQTNLSPFALLVGGVPITVAGIPLTCGATA